MLSVQAREIGYEKYGRIATAIVREDYPGQPLKEYQYEGRRRNRDGTFTDSFRFEVTEDGKPIFVKVEISHDGKKGKTLLIRVREESQIPSFRNG
jgi:hypothetical protein